MNAAKFSSGDERWPLMAVLTWIATRSLKLTEKLAFSHPAEAGRFLFETRRKFGAPLQLSYSDSFNLLNEKIESHAIAGLGSKIKWTVEPVHEQLPVEQCFSLSKISAVSEACAFHPQLLSNMNRGAGYRLSFADFTFHDGDCLTPNGSGFGFPNPDGARERWTWKAVTFAREDVLRVFADWPVYSAWKLARARGWEPPRGISADWLKTLPAGQYVSLADAVDLLAFGPGRLPIGLNSLEEHATRLRAGLALVRAAKDTKVIFFGKATFRLPQSPGQIAPPSALRKLEPTELAGMTLVIDGARDWLGPKEFADQYPEIGQATNSVRFAGVTVQRESLGRWLAGLSGKTSKKRGPRPAYPWQKIEARLVQLMDYHGDFSADDPEWNAQARLEDKLMEFCEAECQRSPSPSQLRAQIKPRLAAWRNTRK
jgi:hypothetical protein